MMTRRRAERTATQQSGGQDKFRITIVETTSGAEVPLCHECTHRVSELQHDEATFALKAEIESQPQAEQMEETIEDIEVNEEGLEDYSDVENSFKKKPENSTFRSTSSHQSRPRKRSPKAVKRKSAATNNSAEDPGITPSKFIFKESEYDVLEKQLMKLENEMPHAADNDQFKKLCKTGIMCEERWVKLYCQGYGKSLEESRNEAISVLKHNLEIRREGLRPFMRMQNKIGPNDPMPRPIKRDIHMTNPSVSIALGRMGNQQEMYRGMSKRYFATCVPISTLTIAPQHSYSYIMENDPCFMLENELFDVEHRLKRCEPNSKEFNELLKHGRRLREEWRQANEELKRGTPAEAEPPGYDIRKCVVVGRNRKQTRENGEMIAGTADELEDIDIQH